MYALLTFVINGVQPRHNAQPCRRLASFLPRSFLPHHSPKHRAAHKIAPSTAAEVLSKCSFICMVVRNRKHPEFESSTGGRARGSWRSTDASTDAPLREDSREWCNDSQAMLNTLCGKDEVIRVSSLCPRLQDTICVGVQNVPFEHHAPTPHKLGVLG